MKKINLSLTKRQWFQIIEGLDETGREQTNLSGKTPGFAKTRANGRKLLALAENLRKKLKGKI